MFKFVNRETRDEVLQKGPFFVFRRPLMLKVMSPDYDFDDKLSLFVPVWISLPSLPLGCWNARALRKIASLISKPITSDRFTATKERISFACVLV